MKQQEHGTVVGVNIKKKTEIKLSSQSKVYGMKCNLLRLMLCLDFLFRSLILSFV